MWRKAVMETIIEKKKTRILKVEKRGVKAQEVKSVEREKSN